MKCNSNSSFDSLKEKIGNVEFPEIDTSQVNDALAKLDSAVSEIGSKLNDALSGLSGFLNEAITEANKSLQTMIADIQSAKTSEDFANKIKAVQEEFGDSVEGLDEMISKATNGLNQALLSTGRNLDSNARSLTTLFNGGFTLPNVCDVVPNVEKKPDGQVVTKPPPPVPPVKVAAEPVVKEPVKTDTLLAKESLSATVWKHVVGKSAKRYELAFRKASSEKETEQEKIYVKYKVLVIKQYFAYQYARVAGYDNVGEIPITHFVNISKEEYDKYLKILKENTNWKDRDGPEKFFWDFAKTRYEEYTATRSSDAYKYTFEEALLNHNKKFGSNNQET